MYRFAKMPVSSRQCKDEEVKLKKPTGLMVGSDSKGNIVCLILYRLFRWRTV